MIFQHTHEQVMNGTKTQTSRLIKPQDFEDNQWSHQKHDFVTMKICRNGQECEDCEGFGKRACPECDDPPYNWDGSCKRCDSTGFVDCGYCGGKGYTSAPRTVYEVGKTYAVQPGRTKPAIARIRILSISQADVRQYDEGDIRREGFNSFPAFIKVWCKMHDPHAMTYWTSSCSGEYWQSCTRDNAELYQAWKIIFEVVK